MESVDSGWRNNATPHGYWEKRFDNAKVGHAVKVGNSWKAFLDGTYLGTSFDEKTAMIIVDEHAAVLK